jgi:hypothetical protein
MTAEDKLSKGVVNGKPQLLANFVKTLKYSQRLADPTKYSLVKENYTSIPDWILVSQDLETITSLIRVEDKFYKTDHNPISIQISLPLNEIKRPFTFWSSFLKEYRTLRSELKKEISEIRREHEDDPFLALE